MVKHSKDGKKKDKKKIRRAAETVPAVITPSTDAPTLVLKAGTFDLENPELPQWVEERALKSAHYPYDHTMKDSEYDATLTALQVELVKLQMDVASSGRRIIALFEGRDAAGKGGAIFAVRQYMNPRNVRDIAMPKPTDRENGQWYFQRYAAELPTAGEICLFDRSWYNRAGVEPVMGFCTDSEARQFLIQVPAFEKMLADDGIVLFKFWLDIGREMQLKRFHERRHNPLKIWKLSPIDYAALGKWDEYSAARDRMLKATHNSATPWTVVLANDKRRARLAIVRHMLASLDYRGKDAALVGKPDTAILGGPKLLKG